MVTSSHTCPSIPFNIQSAGRKTPTAHESCSHAPRLCFGKLGKLNRDIVCLAQWYPEQCLALGRHSVSIF